MNDMDPHAPMWGCACCGMIQRLIVNRSVNKNIENRTIKITRLQLLKLDKTEATSRSTDFDNVVNVQISTTGEIAKFALHRCYILNYQDHVIIK